jgi:hypothetical protein
MRRRTKGDDGPLVFSPDSHIANAVVVGSGPSCVGRLLRGVCGALLLLVAALAYLVVSRLGFGAPFPAQPKFRFAVPLLPPAALEVVASLPMPSGNLAVASDGRVFFNFHPEYQPSPTKVSAPAAAAPGRVRLASGPLDARHLTFACLAP